MYIPVVVAGQHDQELQRPLHQHAQPAAPSRRGEQQERRRQLRDERYLATAVSRPFLAQISHILRHFSPLRSVLAPESRKPRKNGEKTAQKTCEKWPRNSWLKALGYTCVTKVAPTPSRRKKGGS